MTEKQAIWKSILHWRRMIKWVCGQKPKAIPNTGAMPEQPSCGECALCSHAHGLCSECPLAIRYGNCFWWHKEHTAKGNAYIFIRRARTWRGWLYHARRLLKQLESLRVKR